MSIATPFIELDSPKERGVLLLLVLLGHALLLVVLLLQKTFQAPKPLSIELSLSAPEPQQQTQQQVQPTVPKQIPTPRPAPAPVSKPIATPMAQTVQPITPLPAVPVMDQKDSTVQPVRTEPVEAQKPSSQGLRPAQSERSTSTLAAPAPTVLPNADAAYLTNPKPGYPPLSRRLGEQGVVTLNVLVGQSGEVQKLDVAQSSGHPRLDEAAQKAVLGWRFAPGKRAGTPEAMWVKVPISFILEKR